MVQYSPIPETLKPAYESYSQGSRLGDILGQGLGGGIQQGFGKALEDYYEQKQFEKAQSRNRMQLQSILPAFGNAFTPDQQKAIVESGIPAEQAFDLLKNLRSRQTAEDLNRELNKSNKPPSPNQSLENNLPEQNLPSAPSSSPVGQALQRDLNRGLQMAQGRQEPQIQQQKPEPWEQFNPPKTDRYKKIINQPIPFGTVEEQLKADKARQSRIDKLIERETAQSTKYLTTLDERRMDTLAQENALRSIDHALATGDVDGVDGNYLADVLGIESLRNKAGAELLLGMKQFFLNDLTRAGSRPNQWIEQQIASANVRTGRGATENKIVAKILRSSVDLKNMEEKIADELTDYYKDEIGFVPGDISKEVKERLRLYNDFRQDVLAYEIQKLYEQDQDPMEMLDITSGVTPGTPLTKDKANILMQYYGGDESKARKHAEKLGYKIPEPRIYRAAK